MKYIVNNEAKNESPQCPYCGGEMKLWDDGCGMLWYSCPKCLAEAPVAHTEEAAYASAMKREMTAKELLYTERRMYNDDSDAYLEYSSLVIAEELDKAVCYIEKWAQEHTERLTEAVFASQINNNERRN